MSGRSKDEFDTKVSSHILLFSSRGWIERMHTAAYDTKPIAERGIWRYGSSEKGPRVEFKVFNQVVSFLRNNDDNFTIVVATRGTRLV